MGEELKGWVLPSSISMSTHISLADLHRGELLCRGPRSAEVPECDNKLAVPVGGYSQPVTDKPRPVAQLHGTCSSFSDGGPNESEDILES